MQNILEYAFIRCKGDLIGLGHLSPDLFEKLDGSSANRSDPERSPQENEVQEIRLALERHRWNRDLAAKALGMGRTTLWRKMKKHGLIKE